MSKPGLVDYLPPYLNRLINRVVACHYRYDHWPRAGQIGFCLGVLVPVLVVLGQTAPLMLFNVVIWIAWSRLYYLKLKE